MKRARSPANKAIRREAILDAADQHLTVVGIDGFALSPIAQALSIAKGTIYLYFETRESLLLALIERKVQRWFEAVTIGLKQVSTVDISSLAYRLELLQTFQQRLRPVVKVKYSLIFPHF